MESISLQEAHMIHGRLGSELLKLGSLKRVAQMMACLMVGTGPGVEEAKEDTRLYKSSAGLRFRSLQHQQFMERSWDHRENAFSRATKL